MAALIALLKFSQFLFWCAVLIPPQMLILLFTRGKPAYALPQLWHKMICRAFGIEVELEGAPAAGGQTLYVSNHISYLDIPVISCVLAASFVAKADVAGWPVFGLLAKLHQTIFISRSRQSIQEESHVLKNILKAGGSIIVFPEGTSSDGRSVLPFKSSLFSMVLDSDIPNVIIQPFTVELIETDGKKVETQKDRDYYAWYGDMTLMPHFWQFAKRRGAKVKLHFHPPIKVQEGGNRKDLALKCHEIVASGLIPAMAKAA